jgi:outer membrane protein assembly factor BamB
MSRRILIILGLCVLAVFGIAAMAGVILLFGGAGVPQLTSILRAFQTPSAYRLVTSSLPITLSWQYETVEKPVVVGSPYITGPVYLSDGDDLLALNPEDHATLWRLPKSRYTNVEPVVPFDDTVLVTDVYGTVLKSLRASDGRQKWSVNLQKVAYWPGTPRIVSIVPDADLVFALINVGKGTQAVAVKSATGDLVWKTRGNLQQWPAYLAFIVNGDLAIFTTDYLYHLDRYTGTVNDKSPLRIPSRETLVAVDAVIYSDGARVDAIDGLTAHSKWVFSDSHCGGNFSIPWAPAVIAHTVYIGTSCGLFYAVDTETGKVKWTYGSQGGPNAAGFVEYRGYGYLLTHDMKLHAIDLSSGSEVGNAVFTPGVLPDVRVPGVPFVAVGGDTLLVSPGTHQVFAFSK